MTFLDYVKKAQSLDEVVSLYAEYQVKAREINWTNGDLVRIAVDHFGDKVYGSLAEAGMGTVKHLQQIEKVARAFDPVYREPMFPWSLYRAAYQAAMRTKENPVDVLFFGIEQGWHAKDFANYGRPSKEEYVLNCTCPMCGFRYKITGQRQITASLICPVCDSENESTLLPGEFIPK